jgi:hypothetical protein
MNWHWNYGTICFFPPSVPCERLLQDATSLLFPRHASAKLVVHETGLSRYRNQIPNYFLMKFCMSLSPTWSPLQACHVTEIKFQIISWWNSACPYPLRGSLYRPVTLQKSNSKLFLDEILHVLIPYVVPSTDMCSFRPVIALCTDKTVLTGHLYDESFLTCLKAYNSCRTVHPISASALRISVP